MGRSITMRFTIDENNAVWGYEPTQPVAILFQPNWPDGTPFTNEADARVFAEAWLAHMANPELNKFLTSRPA